MRLKPPALPESQTKLANFHEVIVSVPLWANWLAADANGKVYAYKGRPEISYLACDEEWLSSEYCDFVTEVDLEGMDWKDTLVGL
ncbi:hypothetical protein [Hafnia phage yong3]|nr:hypothetical protein [Hafnia phage yong3]